MGNPLIYIVDDDPSVCTAFCRLMKSAGLQARAFSSPANILEADVPWDDVCLILDIRMPGMSGLELQQELLRRDITAPVIFVTAFDNAEVREQARLAGAAGFLRKPVDDQALLDQIWWAMGCKIPGVKAIES